MDWRESISIADEYASYRDEFLAIREQFASVWEGYLSLISTVKQRVHLELLDAPLMR